MYKYFALLLFMVVSSTQILAQKRVDGIVKFEKNNHDFGKIKKGKPVTCDFLFTNISSKPIAILQVQTSCGCTTLIILKLLFCHQNLTKSMLVMMRTL